MQYPIEKLEVSAWNFGENHSSKPRIRAHLEDQNRENCLGQNNPKTTQLLKFIGYYRYQFSKTHDACYSMQRGQKACDQEFCSNVKNSCDWINKSWIKWISCQNGAYGFYKAVNLFGSSAYKASTCWMNQSDFINIKWWFPDFTYLIKYSYLIQKCKSSKLKINVV